MFRSFRLFKLAGIPVYIHWTFFLLIAFVIFQSISASESMIQLGFELLVLLSVFACVTMHEYGHALTAKRYGVSTQDIILSPIGGVARLNHLPEKPKHELFVAIAGPLVNVAIILLILLTVFVFYPADSFNPGFESISASNFFENYLFALQYINVMLVLFNLIPAFPMDGGRVLRSLLAMKLGRLKATRIAAFIGQGIAVIFIVSAIFKYPILGRPVSTVEQFTLSIIGLFVFSMARAELNSVTAENKVNTIKASDLMVRQFTHLYNTDSTDFAVSQHNAGIERDFLVFTPDNQVIGTLNNEIIQFIASRGITGLVASYYTPMPTTLTPDEPLKSIAGKTSNLPTQLFPVLENDKVVGVVYKRAVEQQLKEIFRT